MIGQNSLIHVSLSYRIGLDIIPLDTIRQSTGRKFF